MQTDSVGEQAITLQTITKDYHVTMNNYPALTTQVASLPVANDYTTALALRQMTIVHEELPRFLLAPEVSALLHYVLDLHRKILLATFWNTGARIN